MAQRESLPTKLLKRPSLARVSVLGLVRLVWPFNPPRVLEDSEFQVQDPIPASPVPLGDSTAVFSTPKKGKDLLEQSQAQLQSLQRSTRDLRSLLNKAAKGLDQLTSTNVKLAAENQRLLAVIESYQPDKRQAVKRDPNTVFANLSNIRTAEEKRQKRLRPLPTNEQLPIDSFVEPSRKRRKR